MHASMSTKAHRAIAIVLQVALVLPLSFLYPWYWVAAYWYGVLWPPWNAFSLLVVSSLVFGGVGLFALWWSIVREELDKSGMERACLAIALGAGCAVSLVWLAMGIGSAEFTWREGEALVGFGLPLAVGVRQLLLLRDPRPVHQRRIPPPLPTRLH